MEQTKNVSSKETEVLKMQVDNLYNSLHEKDEKIDMLANQMNELKHSMKHMMEYMKGRDEVQDQINLHRESESNQVNNRYTQVQIQNLILKEGMELKLYEARPRPLCLGIRESFRKIFYPNYYKRKMREYFDRHGINPLGGGLVFSRGAPDDILEIEHLSDKQIRGKIQDENEVKIEELYGDTLKIEDGIEDV